MHTYLIMVNLTTWELLAWQKITYLKIWPRRLGSPFSQGLGQNLKVFFKLNSLSQLRSNNAKECHRWRMPHKLPSLPPKK
mmetsp:Transcript_7210/g.12174  ORF Transcript_7210/g.12174 Transcript_7210/m.12174 type:complete len:80 (+) Transcript_7210:1894-2133(+)